MTSLGGSGWDGDEASVARPRLEARLDELLSRRLTTLIAGAGSGKTTLLRQWSASQPVAWHMVTANDAGWTTLARSVLDAVRLRIPGLSADLVYAIESGGSRDADSDEPARAEMYAALLCQELAAALSRHLVLILDDLHEIGDSQASARFVAGLCRNAPDRLHVVVGSRRALPFSTARLAMEGHVLDVPAAELAMTEEEVGDLLDVVLGERGSALASSVWSRTAGWAAATRLAAEALRWSDATSLDEVLPEVVRGPLFDYLAEEVLGQESEVDREFLAAVAELPWVNAEMARKVLPAGGESLDTTVRRGVYFADSEHQRGAIRLTPVMQEFIRAKVRLSDDDRRALLAEAGRWYETAGAEDDAMRCLAAAEDYGELARLLRARGGAILASASAHDVIAACRLVPDDLRDDSLTLLQGEAHQVIGDWEAALDRYRMVIPEHGAIAAAMAWRIGLLHHLKGELDEAFVAYERGVVDGSDLGNEAILLGWTASAHWLRGDRDRCASLASQALDAARLSQDPKALAAAHTAMALVAAMEADRSANDTHYLRALEHAQRAGDVLQATRIRVNRGSRSLEEGSFGEALEELDVALRLADLAGFASFRALALSNRGQALLHMGRLEEAIKDLEEARSIYRRVGSKLESYPLTHLGDVYRLRGDTALARAAYQQAFSLAEAEGDLQALVPSLSGMAMLLVDEDADEAARLAGEAVANSAVLGHVAALVAAGRVSLAGKRPDEAAELADRAADVARQRRDLPGLAEALALGAVAVGGEKAASMLDQAARIWTQMGDPLQEALVDLERSKLAAGQRAADMARSAAIRLRRLGALGAAAEAERVASEGDEGDRTELTIKTLGGFGVVRGEGPVPNAEWQSKKARDLLKLLVAGHGKPVHREVLIDRLWPDEDPGKASSRLSVALSTVRSVLDPVKAHSQDHFLAADRETVGLVSERIAIDVDEFIATAERGLRAWAAGDQLAGRALMEAAESSYVGDFLEEDLYEDWAVATREQCRNLCLRIQGVLAETCAGEGDNETATRLYLRMLERDAYLEPAHLGLVRSMAALGRHGAARRAYGIYVARMQELELEPAPFPAEGGRR
ncbi:MAG TPA: tetratricopeptide repeat protein [Acidimicrobiia bacterium]